MVTCDWDQVKHANGSNEHRVDDVFSVCAEACWYVKKAFLECLSPSWRRFGGVSEMSWGRLGAFGGRDT